MIPDEDNRITEYIGSGGHYSVLNLTAFTAGDGFPQGVELPQEIVIWIEDIKNATPYGPAETAAGVWSDSSGIHERDIHRHPKEGSVRAWATIYRIYEVREENNIDLHNRENNRNMVIKGWIG
ncbi:MAG: hypothetical protein IPI61_02510 [Syntrophaceae bacterium]|nr:hypothetical protein [Syntrophaceae bacterium]